MRDWTGKFKKLTGFVCFASFTILSVGVASYAKDEETLSATPENTGAMVRNHADWFLRIPGVGEYEGGDENIPYPNPWRFIGEENKLTQGPISAGTTCFAKDERGCPTCSCNDEEGDCEIVQHPVPKWKSPPDFRHVYEVTNHYIPWMPGAERIYGAYRAIVAVDRRDTAATVMMSKEPSIKWVFRDEQGNQLDKPVMTVGRAGDRKMSGLTWKDNDNVIKSDVVVVTDFPLVAGSERYEVRPGVVYHYIDRYIYETPRWIVGYASNVSPGLGIMGLKRIEADRRVIAMAMPFKAGADMNPNYTRYGAFPPVRNVYRRDHVSTTVEYGQKNVIDDFWSGGYVPGGTFKFGEYVGVTHWKNYSLREQVTWHCNNGLWRWIEPAKLNRGAHITVHKNFSIDTLTETGIMNLRWWEQASTDGWGTPMDIALATKPNEMKSSEYAPSALDSFFADGEISDPTMDAIKRFDANTCGRSLISSSEMRDLHHKSAWRLAGKLLAGTEIRHYQPMQLTVPEWGKMLPFMRANLGRTMTWEPAGKYANTGTKMVSIFPNREFAATWPWAEAVRQLSWVVRKGLAPETISGKGWDTDETWNHFIGGEKNAEKMMDKVLKYGLPFWNIAKITRDEYEHHDMWNDPVRLNRDETAVNPVPKKQRKSGTPWINDGSLWDNWKTMLPAFYRDILPYTSRALGMLFIPEFGSDISPEDGIVDKEVYWGSGKELFFQPKAVLSQKEDLSFVKYDDEKRGHLNGKKLSYSDIMHMFALPRDRSFYRKNIVEIPKDINSTWKYDFKQVDAKTGKLNLGKSDRAKLLSKVQKQGRYMIYPGANVESSMSSYTVMAGGMAGVTRLFPMNPVYTIEYIKKVKSFRDKPDMTLFIPVWHESPPSKEAGRLEAPSEQKRFDAEKRYHYYYYLDGTSNMNVDAFAANPDCACVDTSARTANEKYLNAKDEAGNIRRKKFNNPRTSGLYTPQLFDPPSRRYVPTDLRGTIYFFGVDFGTVPEVPDVEVYAWRIGDGRLGPDGTPIAPYAGGGYFSDLGNLKKVGTVKVDEPTEDVDESGNLPDNAWIGEEIRTLYKDMRIDAQLVDRIKGSSEFQTYMTLPNLAQLSFSSWKDYKMLWRGRHDMMYDVVSQTTQPFRPKDLAPYAVWFRYDESIYNLHHVEEKKIPAPTRYPYPSVYDGLSDDGVSRVCGPDPMVRIPKGKDDSEYIIWEGDKGPFCHPTEFPVYKTQIVSGDNTRDGYLSLFVFSKSSTKCGIKSGDKEVYRIGDSFVLGVNAYPHWNVLYNRYREKGRDFRDGETLWTWESSNPRAVPVKNGVVTCVEKGTGKITVLLTQNPQIRATKTIGCESRETVRFVRESRTASVFPSSYNGYAEVFDRRIKMADLRVPANATKIAPPFNIRKGLKESRFDTHGFDIGSLDRRDYGYDIMAWGDAPWTHSYDPIISLVDPAFRLSDLYSVFGTRVPTGTDVTPMAQAYRKMREMMEKHLRDTYLRGFKVDTLLRYIKPSYKAEITERWNRLLDNINIFDAWVTDGRLMVVGAVTQVDLDRTLYPVYNPEWKHSMFVKSYEDLAKYYDTTGIEDAVSSGRAGTPGLFSVPAIGSYATGLAYQILKLKDEGDLEGLSPTMEKRLREIVRIGEGRIRHEYVPKDVRMTASLLSGSMKTVKKIKETSFINAAFHSVYSDPVPPGQSTHRKRYFLSGTGDFVMWLPDPLNEAVGQWYRVPVIQNDPTTGFLFEPWVFFDTMGFRSTNWLSSRPISVFSRSSSAMWAFGIDRWGRRWIHGGTNQPMIPLVNEGE